MRRSHETLQILCVLMVHSTCVQGQCSNTCLFGISNGNCDDGGPGSEFSICTYSTDCFDCGDRGNTTGSTVASILIVILCALYGAAFTYDAANRDSDALEGWQAARIGIILFLTTSDILLDCVYVFTEPYASEGLRTVAKLFIAAPSVCFFFGTGAHQPLVQLPWGSYAWHTVKTIRGRKAWGTDKNGGEIPFRIGLAYGSFSEWDQPLSIAVYTIYFMILRPILSSLLFFAVYLYVFILRPLFCIVLLFFASNLRLAVYPSVMEHIVAFVKAPPNHLFGVNIAEIDPEFTSRVDSASAAHQLMPTYQRKSKFTAGT